MEEHKEKIEPTPSVILQPSFDLIFELLDSKEVLINIPKYNIQQQPAVLNRNINNGFTLTIKIANTTINWLEPCEIEIYINKNIYITSNFYITKMGYICTGQIQGLHLKNATHIELYNRFAICTQNTPIIDYYINTTRYNDESTRHLYGRLPITVGNKHLILYESKVRDLDYFIIDSKDLIDSKEFSDICYSIMIGIGFISANFIQDEAFYFKSKEPDFSELTDFSYLKLRQSIISGGFYNPIYSNPYGYTDKDTTIVNEIGYEEYVYERYL